MVGWWLIIGSCATFYCKYRGISDSIGEIPINQLVKRDDTGFWTLLSSVCQTLVLWYMDYQSQSSVYPVMDIITITLVSLSQYISSNMGGFLKCGPQSSIYREKLTWGFHGSKQRWPWWNGWYLGSETRGYSQNVMVLRKRIRKRWIPGTRFQTNLKTECKSGRLNMTYHPTLGGAP